MKWRLLEVGEMPSFERITLTCDGASFNKCDLCAARFSCYTGELPSSYFKGIRRNEYYARRENDK
jgi:hypothetical protein